MALDEEFYIDIIQFKSDKSTIQVFAHYKQLQSSKDKISFTINNETIKHKTYIREDLESTQFTKGYINRGYSFEFEWKDECDLQILKNDECQKINYSVCSKLSRLPQCFKEENGFVFNHNDTAITIKRKKLLNLTVREIRFWGSGIAEYGVFRGLQAMKLRTQIRIARKLFGYNKTLITDRINAGSDNGEALYRYLKDKNCKGLAYLILPDSDDGKRLKKEGFNIIEPFSKKHFFHFFTSSNIASSSFDALVTNPFKKYISKDKPSYLTNMNIDLYFGLLDYKYIFLTHGQTKNDMTKIFRKENKNFSFILTNNEKEAEHFTNANYNFRDKEIIPTGQPRFDYLKTPNDADYSKENIITIMPTWRKGLLPDNFVNGQRVYYNDFKETDLFQFYNSILANQKLIDALEKYNFSINFLVHPALVQQIDDFKSAHKRIKILTPPYNFAELANKTKIFVTDYSSIFFDFAYTGACVIYSQFDRETFFTRQKYSETFWTYKENGLGPITENSDKTCKKIIEYIKRDGKAESKYLKRYNLSFPFTDKNFSKRVAQTANLVN
ncbi:MAG: CDP-glycerol glycerophosphotransferase family protein [Bifidobacteriaceae bacterium]|jgi:CDP-glycerol glycerophosphotransferase (TagB/SpsB family)|nr:CDP-glycerol glycerophosphotransferase family protein [Bifidobacteriaceae bacterium]